MHQQRENEYLAGILQRFCVAPNPYQHKKGVVNHSFFVLVRARGLESQRDDAKPSFDFGLATRFGQSRL